MTIEEIRKHYAMVVMAVLTAESNVTPTLMERMSEARLQNGSRELTEEQLLDIQNRYVDDIALEMLSRTKPEDLEKIYGNVEDDEA